ncbi:MAG: alpha/beta hydrolase [Gammaproteobacteria bacterium]
MSVNPDLHRRKATLFIGGLAGLAAMGLPKSVVHAAETSPASDGVIDRFSALSSQGLSPREIEVWRPPEFDPKQRYKVLYMHDGQMLFDPTRTWNRQAWEIDRTGSRLIEERLVQDFIVVGIANDPARRHAEFFPQAALNDLHPETLRASFTEKALGGRPAADDYLKFIVEVVKPLIDRSYPTLTSRDSTFIMGSSMGGLISLYAACEYPEIFGGAAALSTHWIGTYERNNEIPSALMSYLDRKLPAAGRTRLYMDRGTRELDALYDEAQARVDALMIKRGYTKPFFETLVFPDAGHNETSWAARVGRPIQFLLGRP